MDSGGRERGEAAADALSAEHMCMTIRGVRKPGAWTVTSALRGLLQDDDGARQEFFSLVG